jgi:methyl-accepting chemotaxis protein
VADHVRKLAEQSSNAADQIAALIAEVRSGTDVAVDVMERERSLIEEGQVDVERTSRVLQRLFRGVEETARLNDEIVDVLSVQLSAVERVEKASSDIAAVVEQNAAGAEETAAATEEQAAFMQEITSSSHELADMAGHLAGLVAQFTVSTNGSGPVKAREEAHAR